MDPGTETKNDPIYEGKLATQEKNEEEIVIKEDFVCTPYEFENKSSKEVDYNKLIEQFGTKPITKELLEEFQRLTGSKPHPLLRRSSQP